MATLTIGDLAKKSGVKVPTIRFYEQIGLMPAAPRSESNRRLYGSEAVRRLRFIRHARELGFEVKAIRQLLALADDPYEPCYEADAIARAHLGEIDSRITALVALRAEVQSMVDQCARGTIRECRVIESLGDVAGS
jgi:DNA-binding transcriptional MerR regulator